MLQQSAMKIKECSCLHQNDADHSDRSASKQRSKEKSNYHPRNGPDTNRLSEIKFGKLRNPFTNSVGIKTPTLSTGLLSRSIRFLEATSNRIGKFLLARRRFKDSGFRKTRFPLEKSGVADCESFQGGEERKRGPERGIHLEKGEKNLVREEARLRAKEKEGGGGEQGEKMEREVAEEWNGRERTKKEFLGYLLVYLRRMVFNKLKTAIAVDGENNDVTCSRGFRFHLSHGFFSRGCKTACDLCQGQKCHKTDADGRDGSCGDRFGMGENVWGWIWE